MSNHSIPVLIAHERRFVAFSIANLLDDAEFDVIANISGAEDIDGAAVIGEPKVCIIGAYGADLPQVCKSLRARFPNSRLALLDAGEPEEMIRIAQAQRLDGCLSLDLTPDLILSGLKLVAAGTRCYPQIDRVAANDVQEPSGGEDRVVTLTPREMAVLSLIGEGLANKVIARELSITESTVKAHLNSVLRKTGTSNRTQAARWAFERGQVA